MKVAINGLGRIGRAFLKRSLEAGSGVEVVAINDLAPVDQLAYLLRYDSAYGRFRGEVAIDGGGLVVAGRKIPVFAERDPAKLPWGALGVVTVAECTGVFRDKAGCMGHVSAGALRVVVSAPAKDMDLTVVMGVNDDRFDPAKHQVVSNASCTTNCVAPLAKVIQEKFGIETGMLTTIHAYTSSQALVDGPARKYRRGRAAAVSIVPTSTGAARAVAEVMPELDGKLDGIAMRVPVLTGSVVDLVVRTSRAVSVDALHAAFREAANGPRMRGILTVADDELVSADIIGDSHSSIVDSTSTMTLGDRTAKVIAWYDNEWGYASRLVDCVRMVSVGPKTP